MTEAQTRDMLAEIDAIDDSAVFDEYRKAMSRALEEQRQVFAEFKAFSDVFLSDFCSKECQRRD